MAAWHPLADEALAALAARGVRRAVALPLYPQESRTTTGSSLDQLEHARAKQRRRRDRRDPALPRRAPATCRRVVARIEEAVATLPAELRDGAGAVLGPRAARGLHPARRSLPRRHPHHGRGGDRRLGLGARASLCFQSRVGPQRWLGPTTEAALDEVAAAGTRRCVVVPIAFTGEHIETLQEIDILYKERAAAAGIVHFARARTVGCHPAFIAALADLVEATARARGWT